MDKSRADEMLLSCLRAAPGGAGVAGVGELSSTDWEDLLRTSILHGVTPLLYHRLSTFHAGAPIPAEVIRSLRSSYLQNAARNMQLYHELGKVLGRLRQDAIPVIALKGAHLATAIYGNIALRPMGDVDLLVKQADLSRVHDILIEQRYFLSKEDIFSSYEHLPPYRKKDSLRIEIHFTIAAPPFFDRVDVEKLFARARPHSISGIEVLVFCPEDLLLHLCVHASYHHAFNNGVMPLFDISAVLGLYAREVDWEQVLSRSKSWGINKCVYVALSLSERIAGAPVPAGILTALDACRDGFGAVTLAEELLYGKGIPVPENLAKLFSDNPLRKSLLHFISRTFPPIRKMADMAPGQKNPLSLCSLYFFRIKGLFSRHGKTIWRLILRDKEMSTLAEMQNKRNALKGWLVK